MARSKVVGQVIRTDNDRFMFRLAQGNLLRANTVWTVAEIDMSSNSLLQCCTFSSCGFFLNRFRFQTDATGWTDDTSPYGRMRTAFSLRATLRTIHWPKVFERFSVCLSKAIPSAASAAVASARRSIFLPITAPSSWRETQQSPLRRTLTYLDIPQHQAAASTVPTLTSSKKLVADNDCVASQTGSRKMAADVDHETTVPSVLESVVASRKLVRLRTENSVVSTLLRSVSREKRDRDLRVVQTLDNSLNGKLAVRGETLAQQKLFEAETDMEDKHCDRRKSEIALYLINQEFESQI